jgi:transcriptional repressor NrdR
MRCPYCGNNEDRVLDTREQKDGDLIRRRRECTQCKSRFTTIEMLSVSFPLIIKKDGRREAFSKDKILKGLQAACQKRPISLGEIESALERISNWVLQIADREVASSQIGHRVMLELKRLDDVAYVRFASVYRTFKDVQEFVETLEDQEGLDVLQNPEQLSLKPERTTFVKPEEKDRNHETTSPRDRTPDPIPN